jgi:hypothetical protein
MRPRHLLVRTVMIVVAVVAIDFATTRAIFSRSMTVGIGLQALINALPIGLVLNIGLVRAFCTRGRVRTFWVGFLVSGALAMMSSAWAALTPAGSVIATNGGPNKILQGSRMWFLWNSYFVFTVSCLETLHLDIQSFTPASLDKPGIGYIAIVGLMAFVPQLAIALVGGLAARAITLGHFPMQLNARSGVLPEARRDN